MGWNGSGLSRMQEAEGSSAVKPPKHKIWICLAAVVVVLSCLVAYVKFANVGTATSEMSDSHGKIKDVAGMRVVREKVSPTVANRTKKIVVDHFQDMVKEYIRHSPTNKIEWAYPPLEKDDPDRALYTRVSCELSLLLAIEPGDQLLPFPFSFMDEDESKQMAAENGEPQPETTDGNREFQEALKRFQIKAKATDSDERLAFKERLLSAQSELLSSMDEGISVNDAIRAAWEFRKRAYEMRTTIVNTLAELHSKDGNDSDTIAQIEDMNKRLAEEGIKKIEINEVIEDYETEEDQ